MTLQNHWLLPEGIEELLPPKAAQVEQLCRDIIDLYIRWGYQLVMPPLIDYLDSLLTGTGEDLDLQTFKLTDQLSGRLLGVRADTTPQVARIDAHNLNRDAPTRLCYLGTVLHTRPEVTGGTRSPLQVGAELYGHQGIDSDTEILCLMLESLKTAGVNNIHVDLGHVGIYQGLVKQAGLVREQELLLFDVLQRKALPELNNLINTWKITEDLGEMFRFIIMANGNDSILEQSRKFLAKAGTDVLESIDNLQKVADCVKQRIPEAPLNFDLAELRGYHYHTGIVFAAYVPGKGQGVAFGGRYDDIGIAFGRARPATGFSMDVKTLLALNPANNSGPSAIFAPGSKDPDLYKTVMKLRNKGEIVISELPGQKGDVNDMGCDRKLELKNSEWKVVKIKK